MPVSEIKKDSNRPPRYKSKYNPFWHPQLVFWMARDGLTDEEMSKKLKIATSTFYKWKNEFPEFAEAIKRGKKNPDDLVEQSLYQRATGYSYPEDKIMQYEGEPIIVETIRHVPPDPTSMIFWLKNRRPKKWRDKQDLTIETDNTLRELLETFRSIK